MSGNAPLAASFFVVNILLLHLFFKILLSLLCYMYLPNIILASFSFAMEKLVIFDMVKAEMA